MKYDLKLVATREVLPKLVLLFVHELLKLNWLGVLSSKVVFVLLPLFPLAIGGTRGDM